MQTPLGPTVNIGRGASCVARAAAVRMERTLRAAAAEAYSTPVAHPVEHIQQNWLRDQLETKHYIMAQTYGAHLPMQIRMELDILSQSKRLPGIRSSNIAAETILGRDETIDFEDYLGTPDMSETAVDFRAVLEKKYGVAPRNPLKSRVGGPLCAGNELPRPNVAMARML